MAPTSISLRMQKVDKEKSKDRYLLPISVAVTVRQRAELDIITAV